MKYYQDANGNKIPVDQNMIVGGCFFDIPQAPDFITVANIPVPGQTNNNTATAVYDNVYSYLNIKHDGQQYASVSYSTTAKRCGVFAIPYTQAGVDGVQIIGINGVDDASLMNAAQTGGYDYNNYIVGFLPWSEVENHIVEDEAWDESPADDANNPDNMLPRGGEFADTDPLGFGNDEIDVPDVINELSYSGFITAYKLDDGGVQNLGAAIFTNNTWTNLQNKFNGVGDPVSYIISAVEIPYAATQDAYQDFNLGGIKVVDNNNNYLSLPCLHHRYHRLNFGSLTLKETWGTEKDYSGTSVSIYLPYVGVKDLDTALVMNSVITVKAMLDVWTGDLLYLLVISNKNAAYKYLGSSGIVYRFQGNCGKSIPIGKTDNTTQMLAIAGSIASMGVGLASGLPTGAMGYTVGNEFGASGDVSGNVNPRLVGGGAAGMLGALTMGPKISMAGGIAGAIGRGDYQQPYLIIKQSVPVYPKDWRAHFGAPRYQTFTLGDLNGFVKCADVHAESIEGANDAERAAIEQALKAGVFMN